MEICCHQGPGVYLQSGFPSEGLTLGGFNLIILHFIFSLSHVFLPMCPYISDFFVSEKILCFPFIDFVTLLTVTFFLDVLRSMVRSVQFSSVTQSCPTLCNSMNRSTQASLSITISQSSLRLKSIESVMPSSHLILCRPLLLPPIPPSIRVFSNESILHMRWPKY